MSYIKILGHHNGHTIYNIFISCQSGFLFAVYKCAQVHLLRRFLAVGVESHVLPGPSLVFNLLRCKAAQSQGAAVIEAEAEALAQVRAGAAAELHHDDQVAIGQGIDAV